MRQRKCKKVSKSRKEKPFAGTGGDLLNEMPLKADLEGRGDLAMEGQRQEVPESRSVHMDV